MSPRRTSPRRSSPSRSQRSSSSERLAKKILKSSGKIKHSCLAHGVIVGEFLNMVYDCKFLNFSVCLPVVTELSSVSDSSALKAMVESLAPALLAELAKKRNTPLSSSAKSSSSRKRSSSPSKRSESSKSSNSSVQKTSSSKVVNDTFMHLV